MKASPHNLDAGSLVKLFTIISLLLIASSGVCSATRTNVDLNTPRTFPAIPDLGTWQSRAAEIRQQALFSCGLWPLPPRTPLNPQIFGRIERNGYSIEKVYIETMPGFFLAGNLYRPTGKGPFPGILNPHGHWREGRLTDTKDGSAAARCINFARQGMVAFTYDMVGYNDTKFADRLFPESHRAFGTNRTDLLWNITPMGLQTWNSIRALDFLEGLPDVDKSRLACTGESGGGTQTFMLGVVDDRLAAQAPIVMVSHTMQGGCICENAPGLRIKYSNMEISAAAAPRPQILVAATGDWTKATLTVEGPAIDRIYRLFGVEKQRFEYHLLDYGHNYNQETREAVYRFFGNWLLHRPEVASIKELPYSKEPDADLLVFASGKPPAQAKTQEQIISGLKQSHRERWEKLLPKRRGELARFRKVVLPAWQVALQLPPQRPSVKMEVLTCSTNQGVIDAGLRISCGSLRQIRVRYLGPTSVIGSEEPKLAIICTENAGTDCSGLADSLAQNSIASLTITEFSTTEASDQFSNFYSTYNRTKLQERVSDLVAVCASADAVDPRGLVSFKPILIGRGRAGAWALLAAPAAEGTVADCAGLDLGDESTLLHPDLFCPGILTLGGYDGLPLLGAPNPLFIHNAGAWGARGLESTYRAVNASDKVLVKRGTVSDQEIVEWIGSTL